MIKCKRCGKCCVVFNYNNNLWEPCKHLRGNIGDKTRCTIYPDRLGTYLGSLTWCKKRFELPYDIPGCPYNTGKPVHPAYSDPGFCTSRSY